MLNRLKEESFYSYRIYLSGYTLCNWLRTNFTNVD